MPGPTGHLARVLQACKLSISRLYAHSWPITRSRRVACLLPNEFTGILGFSWPAAHDPDILLLATRFLVEKRVENTHLETNRFGGGNNDDAGIRVMGCRR